MNDERDLGPIMLGLDGTALSAEERELLGHPLVGGVILFTRNYASPEQLQALVAAVRRQRPGLLIGADHEGGRVQRFRNGFTELPAPRRLGEVYEQDRAHALQLARQHGWLTAAELRAADMDISFTPVLDLDRGVSQVIGNRAFHAAPDIVTALAEAYVEGLSDAGITAVGKHFPGHGSVGADSHQQVPRDDRPYPAIAGEDLLPFARLIENGLAAVMPSHVIYTQVDDQPAGFSRIWLQDILRQRLGFRGAIISDDLDMAAAAWAGGPARRAQAALSAGVDLLLACNDRSAAIAMLDGLPPSPDAAAVARRERLRGRGLFDGQTLAMDATWQQAVRALTALA